MGKYIPVEPEKWGEMVKAMAEVTRLKAEVERLTKAHSDALADFWAIHKGYFDLKSEVERLRNLGIKLDGYVDLLQGENARLRKAGDELERVLTSRSGSYEAGNASHEWQSAKNYKPSV